MHWQHSCHPSALRGRGAPTPSPSVAGTARLLGTSSMHNRRMAGTPVAPEVICPAPWVAPGTHQHQCVHACLFLVWFGLQVADGHLFKVCTATMRAALGQSALWGGHAGASHECTGLEAA